MPATQTRGFQPRLSLVASPSLAKTAHTVASVRGMAPDSRRVTAQRRLVAHRRCLSSDNLARRDGRVEAATGLLRRVVQNDGAGNRGCGAADFLDLRAGAARPANAIERF